jgi:hypothetical protein
MWNEWGRRGTRTAGNQEGKRLEGRPRRRWVDSIKMDRVETRWDRNRWKALMNA